MTPLVLKGPLDLTGSLNLTSSGKILIGSDEALVEGASGDGVAVPLPPTSPIDTGLKATVKKSFNATVKANGTVFVALGMTMQGDTPTWPGMVLRGSSTVKANGVAINVKGDKAITLPIGAPATLSESGQKWRRSNSPSSQPKHDTVLNSPPRDGSWWDSSSRRRRACHCSTAGTAAGSRPTRSGSRSTTRRSRKPATPLSYKLAFGRNVLTFAASDQADEKDLMKANHGGVTGGGDGLSALRRHRARRRDRGPTCHAQRQGGHARRRGTEAWRATSFTQRSIVCATAGRSPPALSRPH